MKTIVGLMSYGQSGNLYNVQKALEQADSEVMLIENERDLNRVDRIVLPGVGSFPDAMAHISDMKDALRETILRKPCLGICLGMQILSTVGFEFEETQGLGIIGAEVKRMEVHAKVPHIGWSRLKLLNHSPIFKDINGNHRFYFMHSYEVVNYTDVVALSSYRDHVFVSAVQKGNVFGVQFHPEKSREAGLTVLRNFLEV